MTETVTCHVCGEHVRTIDWPGKLIGTNDVILERLITEAVMAGRIDMNTGRSIAMRLGWAA